ncbi:hypothetical protein AG1IA_01743 [Rhizoctonia solani AG-1 IA]|uniref:Uncharacterized protein n=1 Tax=Thanatephorus cucumeris (strain AG1-IA) TaxID=983506 RepID=L8X538_THACA|nr:hypothetical protein AG1IA_01743 [Rhizoctonia solani AG-1 IA]
MTPHISRLPARRNWAENNIYAYLFTETLHIGFTELLALPKLRDPAVNLLGVHSIPISKNKKAVVGSKISWSDQCLTPLLEASTEEAGHMMSGAYGIN